MKINIFFLSFMFIAGCSIADEDINYNQNHRPKIACGVQCLTINQHHDYNKNLKKFLKHQNPNKPVLIAACSKTPASNVFMEKVAKSILTHGLRVAKVRPIIPYNSSYNACLVLVRGPVIIYPTKCLPTKRKRGAFIIPIKRPLVSDNFGCYSQQNLAYMVDNPQDLLILGGYSGQIR